jgi:ERCC4-type nuclease
VKIIESVVAKDVEKPKPEKLVVAKADKPLMDIFDMDMFIDKFPGVTAENAESLLAKFKTLRDFANATNVDLRTAGVRSNFFTRLRAAAMELLDEYEDEE